VQFTLGFLMVVEAFAQTTPDASALLAHQSDQLQRYRTYQLTQDMNMNIAMPGMSMPAITYTTVTQAVNPGKMRMEMKVSGIDMMLVVSDGKQTWMYTALTKQYMKITDDAPETQDVFSDILMPGMPDMQEMTANAKVTGSESIEVDGQQRDCWVVESDMDKLAIPGQATTMENVVSKTWIDKTLGIQLKMSFSGKTQASAAAPATDTRMTVTTGSMKFDEDLPDSLFVFTPPADAKETEELFPGTPGAASAKAPATNTAKAPAPGEPEAYVPNLSPTHRVEPDYPREAKSKGLQGDVQVLLTIDATGAVTNAEPLTGPEGLRAAALDTVKQWSFRPVARNGHAVGVYSDVVVNFFLKSEKPPTPEEVGVDFGEDMKAQQRIQELEAKFPRTPEQVLADTEDQKRGLSGMERYFALPELARQALAAGDLPKASSYATELLQTAKENKMNPGEAVFTGNMVLGLASLRQGSVSQARQYLLESGKSTGSPMLASFGPDFALARELLAKGERDAVVEFLTECKGFWKSGAEQLDAMIEAARSGRTF
jgi:TonB family protein